MVVLGVVLVIIAIILFLSGLIDFENAPIVEANTLFVRIVGIIQIVLAAGSFAVGGWIVLSLIG
ncbi:MAG: hypothetical protein SPL13_02090 [Clostridia bacterium]|nr:hypothetical protein [Clostridia bacterium]